MAWHRLFTFIALVAILGETVVANAENDDACTCESKLSLRTKAGVTAATAGLAGALGVSGLGSSFVGFTMAGIAKGSLAAFIQAKIGVFGLFSVLQSIGATGGFLLGGPLGIGVAGVVGAASYWMMSGESEAPRKAGCSCGSEEPSTEEELKALFALKAIESCVEPGTSRNRICSGNGLCEFNKEDEELYCECQPNFAGTYCEISNTKQVPSARCKDEFLQSCIQCQIHKFTLNDKSKPKNCYEKCNWENRIGKEMANYLRPDVASLEMRRVIKMNVIQGTECTVPVNSTCSTTIKYGYEHSNDHLDQLVVYFSSDEAFCGT